MKKHFLKKSMVQIVAAVVLIFSIAVPVAAATNETDAEIARGSTSYSSYSNLLLYSGVRVFTASNTCTSQTAVVKMTNIVHEEATSSIEVGVATYPPGSETAISSSQNIKAGGIVSISGASQYPGQSIRAGFFKENINGIYYLTGRFYYNGL